MTILQLRAETAAIVSSWEVAQEFISKRLRSEQKQRSWDSLAQLQVHERQAMVRAVEAYGVLQESETPSVEYLSLKAEKLRQTNLLRLRWMRFQVRRIPRLLRCRQVLTAQDTSESHVQS